jgi:hypothetical protein
MGWAKASILDRLVALLDFPQEWIRPQRQRCGPFFAQTATKSHLHNGFSIFDVIGLARRIIGVRL